MEGLEQRDFFELCNEYKKQRIVEENRALDKIKEASSYFYIYSQEFCKSKHAIPSLKNMVYFTMTQNPRQKYQVINFNLFGHLQIII